MEKKQTKIIKDPVDGELSEYWKDLPEDIVNRCSHRLAFIQEFFMNGIERSLQLPVPELLEMSSKAAEGLSCILSDIEHDLDSAFNEPGIEENQKREGQPQPAGA